MGPLIIRIGTVVFLLICQLGATQPLRVVSALAAEPPQESVTGHVEFIALNGNQARYSVNAIRHRDGSVTGEFEFHVVTPSGDPVLRSHVTITCFTIVGNVAFIGGVVDRSSGIGAPPGTEGYITVVDNGEGHNALADLASPTGIGPGTAEAHCETGLSRPLLTVVRGNIQVRPSGL
jgi:hypothetical protein